MGDYEELKKCPFCAEAIKKEAIVCRYCGRDLPDKKNLEQVAISSGREKPLEPPLPVTKPAKKKNGPIQILFALAVLLCLIFICGKACDDNKTPGQNAEARHQDSINAAFMKDTTTHILGKPENICGCLSIYGFKNDMTWEATTKDFYSCSSIRIITHSEGNLTNNEISFTTSGSDAAQINTINLTGTVFITDKEQLILAEYNNSVQHLFKALNLEMPKDLMNAVKNLSTFESKMNYGTVRFEKRPGQDKVYSLILSIT